MTAKTNATATKSTRANAANAKGASKETANAKATQSKPAAKAEATGQETLYQISKPFKVRESSARGYAQAQLRALAEAHPKGFTIAQYRQALIDNLAGVEGYQPKGGWEKHNMPTWSLGQDWIAPVSKAS